MTKLSKSPERHSFQKKRYIEINEDASEEEKENSKLMLDYYETYEKEELIKQSSPDWAKNNLEYDLRSTDWILEKVRSNRTYAQNLYAALCNNDFQKLDTVPILKEETWSCSWRYAGGIIADMREEGDYIDWYCSGIRDTGDDNEGIDVKFNSQRYVDEGFVSKEIYQDLLKLGWKVIDNENNT